MKKKNRFSFLFALSCIGYLLVYISNGILSEVFLVHTLPIGHYQHIGITVKVKQIPYHEVDITTISLTLHPQVPTFSPKHKCNDVSLLPTSKVQVSQSNHCLNKMVNKRGSTHFNSMVSMSSSVPATRLPRVSNDLLEHSPSSFSSLIRHRLNEFENELDTWSALLFNEKEEKQKELPFKKVKKNRKKSRQQQLNTQILESVSTKQFNEIRQAAYLAAAVYDKNQTQLQAWQCKKCSFFTNFNASASSNTQVHLWMGGPEFPGEENAILGYMLLHPDWLILSYKGASYKPTQRALFFNLIKSEVTSYHLNRTNQTFQATETVVHRFEKGLPVFLNDWIPKLKQFYSSKNSAPSKVWFVGHSMGGGLATLAALQFLDLQPLNIKTSISSAYQLIFFNSPKLGDQRLISALASFQPNLTVWNVVDYQDPVPRVPYSKHSNSTSIFQNIPQFIWAYDTKLYQCPSNATEYCNALLFSRPKWSWVRHMEEYHTRFLGTPQFFGSQGNN